MSFLNPLLLGGIAGVASPIIIHLLAKKRVQRVVWAAMRFLRVTVDRQQRRMTLEDLILLILRCAVVALLAFALARPALRSSGALGLSCSDESALILLDVSGSMSTTDGAETRFAKAQKAAEQILDALPGGASVAVWLVSDTVRDVIPEPTHDFALARRAIREAKRTDQGTEWQPALRRAVDTLRRQGGLHKQLYVVTDSQAAGWRGLAEARTLLDEAKKDVPACVVTITEGEQRNLGVTGLRLASALAPVNQPLRFEASIANFGPEPAANVSVSLAIDDAEPQDEQTLDSVAPGGDPKTIALYATFRDAGYHTVTARLRSDRCPFDDQRTFALRVIDEINVLLVDGDPGGEARESEVFYLRNALTPVPPELRDQYFIKTKTVAASALDTLPLRDFEAIILANVVDLSAPAVASLDAYVHAGGGLMVFPGNRISAQFYNDQLFRAHALLPAEFGPPRGDLPPENSADRPKEFFTLQSKDYTHPIVEPWRDPKSGTLSTAQFYRAFILKRPPPAAAPNNVAASGSSRTDLPPTASTSSNSPTPSAPLDASPENTTTATILTYSDGTPAIMERTADFGRVVQFSSTADAGWNDLPVRPVFLPLIHRTLGYLLARQEERLNLRTGTLFSYGLPPDLTGKEVLINGAASGSSRTNPSSHDPAARPTHLRIQLKSGTPVLEFPDTLAAGPYEARFQDDAHPPLRFAAAPPPTESDLTPLSTADTRLLASTAQLIPWTPTTDLRAQLTHARTGTELWLPFALCVLCLATAETLLGNRWSRSK